MLFYLSTVDVHIILVLAALSHSCPVLTVGVVVVALDLNRLKWIIVYHLSLLSTNLTLITGYRTIDQHPGDAFLALDH